MTEALAFDRVAHRYGDRPVLHDVTFAVAEGEVLCLLGPSGCGKTTTLRIAAGLEAPSVGTVALAGEIIAGPGLHVPPERRRIGYMSQDLAVFPHLTAIGNVEFGLDRLPPAERRTRARAMLAKLGMGDLADAWPHEMSGGQQQRVALARALAPEPKLMLLDEPFSGLDRRLRDRVWEEAVAILKGAGVATLMVTHDTDEAMGFADRIAAMRDGRLVQVGTQEDLYDRPADGYVARLFGEVNVLDGTVRGGTVATALGPMPAPGLAEGTKVEVLVRPEAVRLNPMATGVARVLEIRFLGAEIAVRIALDGAAPLAVRSPRDRAPPPGERVSLVLDPAGVFVFPRP